MSLLLIVVGLALLTGGAELLVRGASSLALRAGISSFVVGLTVVGFGTSTPELGASLAASLRGSSDIAVGNVVGSNIFNIAVILALTALVRPIPIRLEAVRGELLWMIGAAFVPLAALATGGEIGPGTGAALVALLCAFVVRCYLVGRRAPDSPEAVMESDLAALAAPAPDRRNGLVAAVQVVVGLALLVLGSRALVSGSIEAAGALGVSELVIGLTIVAAGTSAPELVTSVVAAARGRSDLALGNVLGSNVFNAFGILGAAALVTPQAVPAQTIRLDAPVTIGASLALAAMCVTGRIISRREAVILLLGYGVYLAALIRLGTAG